MTNGSIPQSTALAEAGSGEENLQELMRRCGDILAKDPETMAQGDLADLVVYFRAMRERWAKSEAEAQAKPKTRTKIVSLSTNKSPEDLGL